MWLRLRKKEAYPWLDQPLSLLVSHWLPSCQTSPHRRSICFSRLRSCNALKCTWLQCVRSFASERAFSSGKRCVILSKSALANFDSGRCTPHAGGSKRKGRCAVAPALRFADARTPFQLMPAPDRSVDIFRLELTNLSGRGTGSTDFWRRAA